MSLGNRLRTLRCGIKLTQQDLADSVGVSRIYIQALESNKRTPSMNLLNRLATALSVSITDIVGEYPGDNGRIQLDELLSSSDLNVWFKDIKLNPDRLKCLEMVVTALIECWESEDRKVLDAVHADL